MKKKLMNCLFMLPGLWLVIGIMTVFAPCVHDDGSAAACAGFRNAVLVLGISISAAALLRAVLSGRNRIFADVLLLLTTMGSLLTPTLCATCAMQAMRCNRISSPAVRFSALVCLVIFVILTVKDILRAKGNKA